MNYLKSTKDSIYPEIFLASLFCRASRDLLEYSSPEMLDSLSQTFGEEDSNPISAFASNQNSYLFSSCPETPILANLRRTGLFVMKE